MNEQKTRFDRLNARVKNNPILATLIVLGTIIIALSTFTDATKNLLSLANQETRPNVNGEWKGEVTYDWDSSKFTEVFTFDGTGEKLYGTASLLETKRSILEGSVGKGRIEFIVKTQEVLGSQEFKISIYHYRGKVLADQILFVMQAIGSYSENVPIEFTARRVSSLSDSLTTPP